MTSHSRTGARVSIVALLACSACAAAETSVRILDVDLPSLVESVADERERFAVDVPQAIDSIRDGEWTQSGSTSTWRFVIRVPDAVSLSFHATPISLPAGSEITVRSGSAQYVYMPSDVRDGVLWSRISQGADLAITLTVPTQSRAQTAFSIDRIQVGFRTLDGSPSDSGKLRIQSFEGDAGNCIQNYACVVTAANTGPAQATVALVVANVYQCTGTLINNVPGDNLPYVLTARHCQTGSVGHRDPASAANVTVYWNSLTPCGQVLHSIYQGDAPTQSGAVTVVEQEDMWLIRLARKPVIDDPYFAGFDATGSVVQGGYTIHHGSTYTKQLTNWFGQAFSARKTATSLGGLYTSHFLGVVNQTGSIAGGASGSALFDQNNRVTGSLSLGSTDTRSCPADSPRAASTSNVDAEFTSFAAVWNSTSDPTSSTGNTTLKSVLDPQDSGRLVVNGSVAGAGPSQTTAPGTTADQPPSTIGSPETANATSGASGGGGGAIDWLTLMALGLIGAHQIKRLRSTRATKRRAPLPTGQTHRKVPSA